jgi:RNA polymerase sigma factor (sigma-70 family)
MFVARNASVRTSTQLRNVSGPPGEPIQAVSSHVVHAIAILRGLGRTRTRPLDEREAQALAVIYRSYGGMLLGVLHTFLPTEGDAEDVLHEVFCRLPWALAQYRDNSFGGWLRQMSVREALTRLRAERRRQEHPLPDGEHEASLAVAERDFEAVEQREELRRALAALPEPLRQVVMLRVYLDFTHQQVAEALGISATASEVRMCRALKQLRSRLRASMPDVASHGI